MSENNFETNQNLEANTKPETQDPYALEDATHEPGSRVEQAQDISTAEAIEQVFIASMEQHEAAQPAVDKIQAPDRLIRDPLTGNGSGDAGGENSSSGSEDKTPAEVELANPDAGGQLPLEAAVIPAVDCEITQTAGQNEGPSRVNPQQLDQDAAAAVDLQDQGHDLDGAVKPDPERLGPEAKPMEKELPIGHGPHGALTPKGGKASGLGSPEFGGSSSGGGAPVNNPGGHSSKGKGSSKGTEGDGYHSGDGPSGRWLWLKASNDGTNYVEEPDGKGVWIMDEDGDWWYQEVDSEEAPAEVPKKGDPIDGDFGTPYTGSGFGGGEADPHTPIGGLDREAGRVHPVLAGSSGKEGGRTPGDKDGEDDSGHFLGDPGLSGSDDYVPPPDDDIPYHELNALNKKNLQK